MVSASLVKDLREKTGAGMMDCKKALTESNGDLQLAVEILRKKGLAGASKKAGRIAAEGLVAIKIEGNIGAVVEVNSETDFVSLNTQFQGLVQNIANASIHCNNLEELKAIKLDNGHTISDEIVENIATIGENINLRRVDKINIEEGVIASYIHNNVCDGVGKIGVIIGLQSKGDVEKLSSLGKQLAMHIVASNPSFLMQSEVSQSLLDKEREIFFERSRQAGKSDEVIAKMVEGRIRKFFEEIVLLDQAFVMDGKTKIADLLTQVSKDLGTEVKITKFVRYEVGEGIQQESKNFSDEVASIVK